MAVHRWRRPDMSAPSFGSSSSPARIARKHSAIWSVFPNVLDQVINQRPVIHVPSLPIFRHHVEPALDPTEVDSACAMSDEKSVYRE